MNWKNLSKRMLYPPSGVLAILTACAAAGLVYSFAAPNPVEAVCIAAYALSFYALMLLVLRLPMLIAFIRHVKRENRYVAIYTADVQLRTNLSLLGAFAFNAVYALFQLALGLKHRSIWFYSMAGYYLLLACMRLILMRYTRDHSPGEKLEIEWRKYRLCGVILLFITFALMVFILYFVWNIRVFRHHEITTIAMATHTFLSLTRAIINVVRYRSYGSPAYSAAKAISLVSAMVSILTLENTMLTAFGQTCSELFRQIVLGSTGVAVILGVQMIAAYMIIHASTNLRSIHRIKMERKFKNYE